MILAQKLPRIGNNAGHCSSYCGDWAGEERPAALALATLEIPVARRDCILSRQERVLIHPEAH